MHVENLKQIHLSDEERATLIEGLSVLPESVEEIRQRGLNVSRSKDYGRISYDVWINAERVYTESECRARADQIIAKRAEQYKRGVKFSEEELLQAGLGEIRLYYADEWRKQVDKIKEQLRERIRVARVFIMQAPEELQLQIKDKAVKAKLYEDDQHWKRALPHFVPYFLEEIEAMMRAESVKPHE